MSTVEVMVHIPTKLIDTKLKDNVALVARSELREEKTTKEQALQQLREWIFKDHDLVNCRTDDNFLLRFLRVKKFSVPMAQQTLLKYLNLRQTFPHIFYNLDYLDPNIYELISSGYMYASPFRDNNGRRIIIADSSKLDPRKHTSTDMAKAHILTYETLLEDEETQVMGFTHIGEVGHVSAAHVTLWSPSEFTTLVRWGEQSMPMRHKAVHLLNVPPLLRYIYEMFYNMLSNKMKERCVLHDSLMSLHKKVDPKALPKEYGGVMSSAEMIELWKKELASKRERLLALDNMKLLSTRSILTRKNKYNKDSTSLAINGIVGSFRRLEVD